MELVLPVAMGRFRTVSVEVPEPSVTVEESDSESDTFDPTLFSVEPTIASVGVCGIWYSGSSLSEIWT